MDVMPRVLLTAVALVTCSLAAVPAGSGRVGAGFDHAYADYGAILAAHVAGDRVNYAALAAGRSSFDRVVASFASVTRTDEAGWARPERMAYWINAYNLFTLKAIIDHYPIRGSFFSRHPRNSIRQISGVWTALTWNAGGRQLTLDDIEHRLLRPEFQDPRVHFAINCASVGCPPLASEPYRAGQLEAQLDKAAVRYLSGPTGLVVDGTTLRLSSIFKWYGDDFVERYGNVVAGAGAPVDRAVLGVVATFGPADARAVAETGRARIGFLSYDWSLNDLPR